MNKLDFMLLPERSSKPRKQGLTCIIDKGLGIRAFIDMLETGHDIIDAVKFGWGTSVVTPNLESKLSALREHGIDFWFGGTLFEYCYLHHCVDAYCDWLLSIGCKNIEISDGTLEFSGDEKYQLIRKLALQFQVFSEVGSKDGDIVMSPSCWVREIKAEISAGASKVITEGRSSGTAGIYRSGGEVRAGLLQEIMEDRDIDINQLLFEAPQMAQQLWFLRNIGWDVNLSNIPYDHVINLETLRLGLRSDTMLERSKEIEVVEIA